MQCSPNERIGDLASNQRHTFSLIAGAWRGALSLEIGAAQLKSRRHVEDDLINARSAPVQFFSSRDPVQSAKVMQVIDRS
jgi:hypothetical protein